MRIITKKELESFILRQNPLKKIDFSDSIANSQKCGCLLKHFAQSNEIEFHEVGMMNFLDKNKKTTARLEDGIHYRAFCPYNFYITRYVVLQLTIMIKRMLGEKYSSNILKILNNTLFYWVSPIVVKK